MHICTQGEKETLQEFSTRIARLAAQEPMESETNIINFIVAGLRIGPCQDFLDGNKPRSITELFGLFQEYSKSNRGRRRRLEVLNAQKRQNLQPTAPKQWQNDQPPMPPRPMQSVSNEPAWPEAAAQTSGDLGATADRAEGVEGEDRQNQGPFRASSTVRTRATTPRTTGKCSKP